MYGLKRIINPEIYQGKYRKNNYFEGWYFKFTNWDMNISYALIPGISMTDNGRNAFIQVIDGIGSKTYYFDFNIDEFYYSEREFKIKIGDNVFTKNFAKFNLKNEKIELSGIIDFEDTINYPKSILRPGIMGIFSYFPNMECNHGVVSLDHKTSGNFIINNKEIDMTDGRGYIEKDWGKSFPSSWIWMQGNDFDRSDVSFMLSVAKVPFLKKKFKGFLGFLYLGDSVYNFATYTRAKLKINKIEDNAVDITITKGKYTLTVKGINDYDGGTLKSPNKGKMNGIIKEGLNAKLDIVLMHNENVIFKGDSPLSGLEISENAKELMV